jgi:tRNA pseudouridine38/39 synthase
MSHEEEGNAGNVGNEQQKTVLSLLKHSISSKDDAIHILNALLEKNRFTIDEVHALLESKEAGDVQKNGKSEASISNTNDNNNKSTSKKKRKKKAKKAKQGSYMTRHIAFRFHYDGATYNGLAENRNCPTDNSVEKILFAALEKTCLIDPEEEDGGGTENILLIENNNNIDCNDTAKATETSNVLNNSRKQCKYSRSGRTDKGVSAFGQVVALKVRSAFPVGVMIKTNAGSGPNKHVVTEDALPNNSSSPLNCWVSSSSSSQTKSSSRHVEKETLQNRTITEKNFCQMLNNVLPPTIRILGWSPVSKDFSARFSTSSRTYRYFFIQRDLKLDDMQKALDYMVGTHDFRNLCKMNCEEVDNFVRVINYAKIVRTQPRELIKTDDMLNECSTHDVEFRVPCYFEIQGQAFLWHQIRCIASILFMIGKGDESPSVVKELLDIKTNPAKPSYPFAPEMPLVLHKCEYKNLEFGHSVHNLWRGMYTYIYIS